MDRVKRDDVAFLIAVPEKALADKVRDDRGGLVAEDRAVRAVAQEHEGNVMNNAVVQVLAKHERRSVDDHVNALWEIFQQIALCGLWRAKLFERAAFYGGTCLRVLYGLDRFSEDMNFSLLAPDEGFDLAPYCSFVEQEW